ncbi:MAG: enoyl-CoA hydratase-related protein [Erythrobacter sp.]|uniref:enoyl-CoA hydratase/isomerase family protein n=1 Tax=Erythrobacter sp. TaxID=1042 RepID=UPI0025ED630D|nr:enoyl-CoA hydratase-related protein [Erythrobacter sp.]MCM0000349.1 enoyl-CoA hydratase-related protein [Erythrobacter sp.]
MDSGLEVTSRGHVRVLTLARPEKRNALSDRLAWAIIDALEEAARDDHVRVVAIKGSHGAFCAGVDLTGSETYSSLTAQTAQIDDLHWVSRFLLVMRRGCDKPIVGGINGAAVGAGLGLAMATDVRLAARSARLMAGYTRIGGSPDGGLTITLIEALGYEGAMRFMLENRTVDGAQAHAIGLVGEVVEDEAFDARLDAYCDELCQWSPLTLRLLKRGMAKASETIDWEAQLRYEVANITRAFTSEDGREARAAFLEKRAPVFKGR